MFNWEQDQIDFFCDCIDSIPDKLPTINIAEYSEKRIILPPGTPRPGRYDHSYTPYSREIMEELSPQSPTREIALMAAVQVTKTAIALNAMLYYMDANPKNIMFATGSQDMIRRLRVERLDPILETSGISEKLQSQSTTSRRKGATMSELEFPGGSLHFASAENPKDFRQISRQVVLIDEVDSFKPISGHEGRTIDLIKGRMAGFGNRYTLYCCSTPTSFEKSEIWKMYEQGDQRKFFVPCVHCGTYQELVFGGKDKKEGIKYETDEDGNLIQDSVYYSCINPNCHKPIYNYHKAKFLPLGEWRPTAIPKNGYSKSYHLSSLYAPIAAIDWTQITDLFLKAKGDPEALKTWINLYGGWPWKQEGYRPKPETLEEDIRHYSMGEVPDGVLFLTAAFDVQRGEKGSKKNASRIEMEIVGHGLGNKTWSIMYKKFYGSVDNPNDGAFEQIRDFWIEHEGVFRRKSDGRAFKIVRAFVDSGYNRDVVYNFCNYARSFYPCRGVDSRVKIRDYGKRIISYGQYVYEVMGDYYKGRVYRSLEVKRKHGKNAKQDNFFCDFPIEYGTKAVEDVTDYFKMLTAEEMNPETGEFSNPSGSRNEALDIRAYNLAAADSWIDDRVEAVRQYLKKQGVSAAKLEEINRKWVIMDLAKKHGITDADRYGE